MKRWEVSPCGEVTHGLDCSSGNGSLLDAPDCAIKKLETDTKQNNTTELSHRIFNWEGSAPATSTAWGRTTTNYAPKEDKNTS